MTMTDKLKPGDLVITWNQGHYVNSVTYIEVWLEDVVFVMEYKDYIADRLIWETDHPSAPYVKLGPGVWKYVSH